MPPCVTTASTSGITAACGSVRAIRTRSCGAVKRAGSSADVVTITLPCPSVSPASAASTIAPSSWNSVETLTSTRGCGRSASQAGASPRGAQRPGPIACTEAGQSERGYSNGTAVR